MKRGYVRASPRVREKPQIDMLTEYGVSRNSIYVQSDEEDVTDFLRSLREGDEACVVTLDRLAKRRSDLQVYMQEIEKRQAILVEAKTGRRAETVADVRDMIFDAVNMLARDGVAQRPDVGRLNGILGGRPKNERMADEQAREIWTDGRYTVDDALMKMTGWTMRSAYRVLGPRKVGGGRPPVRHGLTPPKTRVYFIRSGKVVKIGMSDNVAKRMDQLKVSTHRKLKLVALADGGMALEKELHARFAAYRIRGEWFRWSQEISDYIADLPPVDEPIT